VHFGKLQVIILWNDETSFRLNQFSDNILSRNYESDIDFSQYLPIDVVYLWVNGSDLLLLKELRQFKREIEKKSIIESSWCIKYDATVASVKRKQANYQCDSCVKVPLVLIKPILHDPSLILNNVTKFENYNHQEGSLVHFSSVSAGKNSLKQRH
jgi:Stealth protein CR1, conserved region 1